MGHVMGPLKAPIRASLTQTDRVALFRASRRLLPLEDRWLPPLTMGDRSPRPSIPELDPLC